MWVIGSYPRVGFFRPLAANRPLLFVGVYRAPVNEIFAQWTNKDWMLFALSLPLVVIVTRSTIRYLSDSSK
jgi:hypothetical protein